MTARYNTNFEHILKLAHDAARQAVAAMGEENLYALDCGFAWVTVDGQSALARYCRSRSNGDANSRRFYGAKGYPRGHQWWNPGGFHGQAIGHKEAGAKAFRDAMARHGIVVTVGSRLD